MRPSIEVDLVQHENKLSTVRQFLGNPENLERAREDDMLANLKDTEALLADKVDDLRQALTELDK